MTDHASIPTPPSSVLVGTCRRGQLEKWILPKGLYNYPVRDGDSALRRAAPEIGELWLYEGKRGRRRFAASFVREIDGGELAASGYPRGKAKPHANRYLLFRVTPLSGGGRETASTLPPRLFVRMGDFSRSAKARAAVRALAAGESPPSNVLAEIGAFPEEVWAHCGELRVCEQAEQLVFGGWERGWGQTPSAVPARLRLPSGTFHLGDEPRFAGWTEPRGVECSFAHRNGFLFQGDSLRWLWSLPAGCVDMVFADPPYGIAKAAWDVFPDEEAYLAWCDQWIAEVARVLSPSGTCYVCGFSEILADVKATAKRHFKACRWLVWHYRNKANLGRDWGRSHESILHFRKTASISLNVDDVRIPYGAHTLKYPERTQTETSAFAKSAPRKGGAWVPNPLGAKPKDVFDIPTTCNGMGEKTPHPTQKPEELLRKLVLASSNPGDWILDPFSGSGTTLVAAEQLGRRWLGCDLSAEYNGWAERRLRSVQSKTVAEWIAFDRETAARRDSIR